MRAWSLLVALAVLAPPTVWAQSVEIEGGDVYLQLPFTGLAFGTAVDTSTRLVWQGRQGDRHKITVQTATVRPTAELRLTAVGARHGREAGTVVLMAGMAPQDLITDLPPGNWNRNKVGHATLRYEASTASGTLPGSDDHHRVTFTITQQ